MRRSPDSAGWLGGVGVQARKAVFAEIPWYHICVVLPADGTEFGHSDGGPGHQPADLEP